ncbi:hypothetical protein FC62_GL001243 [Amylolactobacillus amylotrophicus DSM 20534]|nr:hypothetical protein [Amylolactobacillus amylophilus]KRK37629.1 hypothetical protein FC62_GL001243 [Amylolactobacillus amylotrophicus DSM 20534]
MNIILLLLLFNPFNLTQLAVRAPRRRIVNRMFGQMIEAAFYFSAVFVGINVLFNMFHINLNHLVEINFFGVAILYFISAFIFYLLMGTVFLICLSLVSNYPIAVAVTFGLSIGQLYFQLVQGWPTALSILTVYTDYYEDGFNILHYISVNVLALIFIGGLYLILSYIFQRKDILDGE